MSYSGIDKFITATSKSLGLLESKVDVLFYGDGGKKKGIYEKVQAVNEVDICNIINYYLTQAKVDLIKNPVLKDRLKKVQEIARTINEEIDKFTTFTTPNNTARTPENVSSTAQENPNDYTKKQKIINLLANIRTIGGEFFKTIPPELISLVPKLGKAKTAIQDLLAIGSRYGTAADIPNSEIQKIVNTIYDVQNILKAVEFLNSAQGVVNLVGLQKQIQKLQTYINPARIIPSITAIAKTLRNIQQIVMQVLKIVTLTKTIVKIIAALVKAFVFIQQFFKLLALPNMFTVHAVTATLEEAREAVKAKTKEFIELLDKINSLLELVYEFGISLLEIIDGLLKEVTILLVNLQACKQINNDTILDEFKIASESLIGARDTLQSFSQAYANARNNRDRGTVRVGSFTITTIEEEIVDEGKTLKRRRAVAFNDRGLLVLQGDLTFATNTTVLIEELRLKLINQGLAESTDTTIGADEQYALDAATSILQIEELPAIESVADQDVGDVQSEVTSFIDGLKNGVKLRKKVKAKLAEQTKAFKAGLKAQMSTTAAPTSAVSGTNVTTTLTQNALSPAEKSRLQQTYITGRTSRDPGQRQAADEARIKLEKDAKLRSQLAGG